MVSTFGIASMQAAGTFQVAYGTGGNLRGTYAGYAAQTGVMAAYLAQSGVTGTTTPLEGQAGFLEVYFDNEYDRNAMVADLGTRFEGATILFKLWPSCGLSHGYIDSTLRLLDQVGGTGEIDRIEVIGGDAARRLSEPIENRRRPLSEVDAKFSIPFTVAVAAARGGVGVGDFSEEKRADEAVTSIADRVTFTEDPQYNWSEELPACKIRITLTSGQVLETETAHSQTPGSTDKPLTWEEIEQKFLDVSGYAVNALSAQDLEAIARTIRRLESVEDIAAVMQALEAATQTSVDA